MPWLRYDTHLLPAGLVDDVQSLSREAITAALGDLLFLVRFDDPKSKLCRWLHECTKAIERPPKTTRSSTKVSPKALEPQQRRGPPRSFGPRELEQRLRAGSYFIVPLNRWTAQHHSDRIGIGRARQRDLVLYDGTVSSFHGWLNHDGRGHYFLTDNGSTNGTLLNDEKVIPHRFVDICTGDTIAFGDVETLVCSSETLWDVVGPRDSRSR